MTRTRRSGRPKGAFLGALPWALLLLGPFCVLLFETWVHLQVYAYDYEASELNRYLRETNLRVNALEEQEDRLRTMDRIEAQAPDLNLIEPEPNQIQVVRQPSVQLTGPRIHEAGAPDETGYDMARLNAAPSAGSPPLDDAPP